MEPDDNEGELRWFSNKEEVERILFTEEERKKGFDIFTLKIRELEYNTSLAERKKASKVHKDAPEVFDFGCLTFPKKESDDEKMLQRFKEHLLSEGWAFLSYPEDLRSQCGELAAELKTFLFEKSEEEKKKFADASGRPLGYSSVRGMEQDGSDGKVLKEKITVLTREASSLFPMVASFTQHSDALLKRLAIVVAHLCGKKKEELAKDIPMFREDDSTTLFDVALYLNNNNNNKKVHVAAHYDPGFFAVSWYSSCPGLQVYSFCRDQWLDVPLHCGVIWSGKYVHKNLTRHGFLRSYICRYGVHRVLRSSSDEPRLTFWSEICTNQQLDFGNLKFSGLRHDLDDDVDDDDDDDDVDGGIRRRRKEEMRNPSMNLERLLGVPSIKVGTVERGKCAYCSTQGIYRNMNAIKSKQPTLSVKCANCNLGHKFVGNSKEDAKYKCLDALYCNEKCAAADAERHAKECNQQHLKYKYAK